MQSWKKVSLRLRPSSSPFPLSLYSPFPVSLPLPYFPSLPVCSPLPRNHFCVLSELREVSMVSERYKRGEEAFFNLRKNVTYTPTLKVKHFHPQMSLN